MTNKILKLLAFAIIPVIGIYIYQQSNNIAETTFTIWAYGDAQPKDDIQVELWRKVLKDVKNLKKDIAIVAGDLVDRGNFDDKEGSYDLDDFIEDLKILELPRHRMFHVAGNHEVNNEDIRTTVNAYSLKEYDQYFPRRNYYTLWGNILTIYISDESRMTSGRVSDETFLWWKKLVKENQDRIIMTVTHPALSGTTHDSTKNQSAHIPHSQRFIDVLKNYKHDIWIHGHVAYNITDKNSKDIVEKYGSLHMNVGLHIPYVFSTEKFDVSSKFLIFTNNSNKVIIKSRNHVKNKWIQSEETTYTLHTKAELSSEPVFDGRYAFDPDHGIITEPLHLFSEVENPNGNGISNSISRPLIITKSDTRNLNQSKGSGTGILFRIGGITLGTYPGENYAKHGIGYYGVGATLDAVRESEYDNYYSTGLSFKTSTKSEKLDSLTEVMRLSSTGKVGIGTPKPAEELHIYAKNADIMLESTEDSWTSFIAKNSANSIPILMEMGVSPKANAYGFIGTNSNHGLDIRTNARSRVNINNSGNVKIRKDLEVNGVIIGLNVTPSDKRLTTQIKEIEKPLSIIESIQGISYKRKESKNDKTHYGFIAQDIEKIIPDIVYSDHNAYKSISYKEIIAILTEALKEQHKYSKSLEKRIKKLEENKK